jgi:hypothetical protein
MRMFEVMAEECFRVTCSFRIADEAEAWLISQNELRQRRELHKKSGATREGDPVTTAMLGRPHTVVRPATTAFMMHGGPKEEILALIKNASAHLLDTEEHVTEWQSHKYYIVR